TRTILNPAKGEPLAEVAEAGKEDIDAAVQAAHHAFYEGTWRGLDSRERTRILLKLAGVIREEAKHLARPLDPSIRSR
ncbi:MAG: aldehyde dehydrogenase family protein, partial [Planctomycetes bacterium]|nr:aldehyde dehydrogenase family protein [Planctomycetota bacterium]